MKFIFLLSAGAEHQSIEIVCTAINTFGSSNSSLLLTVQTENPEKLTEKKVNAVGSEERVDAARTRDTTRYPGNSRQPAAGMEKLVGGDGENIQLSEEEIFWIPFHPNSNERINQAEENLVNDLKRVRGQGDSFEKAEEADKVKVLYQVENLAGHETKSENFDEKENLMVNKTFDLNSSSTHAPTFYFFAIFMLTALYFCF